MDKSIDLDENTCFVQLFFLFNFLLFECGPFCLQITIISASLSLMASYVNDNVKKNSGMHGVSLFFCNFAAFKAKTNRIFDN